jgi:hypothetical protein
VQVAISFGSILLAAVVFYFVIKWAVTAGINNSMLFTDEQREEQGNKETKEIEDLINENKKQK